MIRLIPAFVMMILVATLDPAGAQIPGVRDANRSGVLGINYQLTDPAAEQIVVTDVLEGGPAALAGIRPGDRIVRWNGRSDVATAVGESGLHAGDTVRVRVVFPGRVDRDLVVVAVPEPPRNTFAVLGPGGDLEFVERDPVVAIRDYRIDIDSLESQFDSLNAQLRILVRDTLLMRTRALETELARAVGAQRARADLAQREPLDFARSARRIERDSAGNTVVVRDTLPGTAASRALLVETERALAFALAGGRSGVAGAELTEMSPGLSSYFGTDEGVLVLRVAPDTPASEAGLQDGDIIVAVAGEPITDVAELRWALARPGVREFTIDIIRHGEPGTLTLESGRARPPASRAPR